MISVNIRGFPFLRPSLPLFPNRTLSLFCLLLYLVHITCFLSMTIWPSTNYEPILYIIDLLVLCMSSFKVSNAFTVLHRLFQTGMRNRIIISDSGCGPSYQGLDNTFLKLVQCFQNLMGRIPNHSPWLSEWSKHPIHLQ